MAIRKTPNPNTSKVSGSDSLKSKACDGLNELDEFDQPKKSLVKLGSVAFSDVAFFDVAESAACIS